LPSKPCAIHAESQNLRTRSLRKCQRPCHPPRKTLARISNRLFSHRLRHQAVAEAFALH
jgi:hypothetical protein